MNMWHVYGRGRHPHACNNVKIIMWSGIQYARDDHVQLLLHNGFLNKSLNTILIWRTDTSDPWNSHGILYLHNWWSVGSREVHNCKDSLTESQSLYGTICHINHEYIQKHYSGASRLRLQPNPIFIRDINLSGSLNRLNIGLELGDNRGLRPNTAQTNTLYESQWCDDVVGVKHVRNKHPKRN